jgi:hypothetical protein
MTADRKPHNVNDPKTGAPITTVVYDHIDNTNITLSVGDAIDLDCHPVPHDSERRNMTYAGRVATRAGWLMDVFTRTRDNGDTAYVMRKASGRFVPMTPAEIANIVTTW